MQTVPDLITQASKVTGSDSATARALGIPPQMVSMWKRGTKTCPPEDQAQLAALAGFDPVQALCRGHIERHAGTKKGENLSRLLGKRLLQTGGASVSFIAGLALISWASLEGSFIRCIEGLTGNRPTLDRFSTI